MRQNFLQLFELALQSLRNDTLVLTLADKEDFFYIETSALDSTNVEDAFRKILTDIYRRMSERALNNDDDANSLSASGMSLSAAQDLPHEGSCCS